MELMADNYLKIKDWLSIVLILMIIVMNWMKWVITKNFPDQEKVEKQEKLVQLNWKI
ncbi:hypothetical protein SDC9_139917 [bioreactor metagenome]|uniref:Uncharacterized protein n=1 Tax=bioreactor metagenome TaxID=1076179 RepID=A0A645DTZ1_9ZZZZ